MEGAVHFEYIPEGQTVNQHYNVQVLETRLFSQEGKETEILRVDFLCITTMH
jgi:hypothetical protein